MIFGILISAALVCVLALLAAIIHTKEYSGTKFKDEIKREKVLDCLPGDNCGACGYGDCASFALALVNGKSTPSVCTPGGASTSQAIGVILGNEDRNSVRMRAQVMCSGSDSTTRVKYIYDDGADDCFAQMKLGGGNRGCRYACVGMGNCAKACSFGAISIVNGTAVVDYKLCNGCGNCITACPKHIIKLIPYDTYYWVGCASKDISSKERYNCSVGCTGCGECKSVCPEGAIDIQGNIATIDYDKCTGCGLCFTACPEGVIWRSDVVGTDGLRFSRGVKRVRINK